MPRTVLERQHDCNTPKGSTEPPYEREKKVQGDGGKRKGGVVRFGTDGIAPLLAPLTKAMADAGRGRVAKGLHNIYVYFWRLATWRATERPKGPGVVAFITAASYLDGVGLGGLRAHMRSTFDELHIVDLGGEGRGAKKEENVFDILTPVAIAVGVRIHGSAECQVNYTRVGGNREEKFGWLDTHDLSTSGFAPTAGRGLDVFVPGAQDDPRRWPISAIFPWSGRGIQFSRSWPVAETESVVRARWSRLIESPSAQRAALLKESRDAQISRDYPSFLSAKRLPPLSGKVGLAPDGVYRLGYRSFDVQWCIADRRAIDMPRPPLWQVLSDKQTYFTALPEEGAYTIGPVLVPQLWVPDLNAFNNRGGLAYPLFTDSAGSGTNIDTSLVKSLSDLFSTDVAPTSIADYVYGLLGTGAWLRTVGVVKNTGPIAVPITRDKSLFMSVAAHGREVLWLATAGQRGVKPANIDGLGVGIAKLTAEVGPALPDHYSYDDSSACLTVGNGSFAPVAAEVWGYEVSGLRVIPSWLSYRLATRAGRKSSALDDIRPEQWELTGELLTLLHTLEGLVAVEPLTEILIRSVLESDLLAYGDVG